ncbi:uncharacterized protein PAN0_002c1019 [Moesziomyces antarcticus]|uniref:uncharacterized protein n=1 Tax=Pseudozyma antarctica TaxID=84753 RepID=UPI0007195AAC|nr:uncharacterized protein PAN0_002c1019 [Moesziomyces antarcticus]GAK62817.1 hypothetical protein PAN0_002c1019 [Moesziomyces antarcticus]
MSILWAGRQRQRGSSWDFLKSSVGAHPLPLCAERSVGRGGELLFRAIRNLALFWRPPGWTAETNTTHQPAAAQPTAPPPVGTAASTPACLSLFLNFFPRTLAVWLSSDLPSSRLFCKPPYENSGSPIACTV